MELNKYIDHTLLKPEATHEDICRVCEEAKAYNTASVCVNPIYASFVAKELQGTDIKTCRQRSLILRQRKARLIYDFYFHRFLSFFVF